MISPLRSATAMPSITVRIVASGGNAAKFATASPIIIARPSWLTRLWTATTSLVPGAIALTSSAASAQLRTITTTASIQNSQNGWGSRLPTRSMALKLRNAARIARDCGSTAVVVDMRGPSREVVQCRSDGGRDRQVGGRGRPSSSMGTQARLSAWTWRVRSADCTPGSWPTTSVV